MFGRTNSGAGTGGGGEKHYATIRVNTDYLFGQPVRVTGAEYDQTAIFTEAGESFFTVNDWGTYTVTSDEKSQSVEVTAWYVTYDVKFLESIEIAFTVEGAKEDNIQIIDSSDMSVVENVIFPTGATSASVTMKIPVVGSGDYIFKSTIAKAMDNTGNDYEKLITLTTDTTNVYVFPSKSETDKSNMFYWFGNEFKTIQTDDWSHETWTTKTYPTLTRLMNSFTGYMTSDNRLTRHGRILVTNVDLSKYERLHWYGNLPRPSTSSSADYNNSVRGMIYDTNNNFLAYAIPENSGSAVVGHASLDIKTLTATNASITMNFSTLHYDANITTSAWYME